MILTRKLILPAVIIFTVLLAGIFVYSFISLHSTYHEAEEADLVSYSDAFVAELENQKNVALALASAAAGDPSIQEAFAQRDRQKLIALTQPTLENLKTYNITQYQFYLPDSKKFLNVNELDNQEVEENLSVVQSANSEQKPVAGLEYEDGNLGVQGVAPVFYQGKYIGAVEFGIGFNNAILSGLKDKYGGEWHILLSKELLASDPSQPEIAESGPIPGLIPYATTLENSLFNSPDSYAKALKGEKSITHPSVNGRDYAILTSSLPDFSGRIVGALDIVYDHTHISAAQNRRLLFTAMVTVLALLLGSLSLVIFTSRTLRPIQALTQAASAIADGNLASVVEAKPSKDEIGTLTTAFNRMTSQLGHSITELEQRVASRTQDLEKQTRWLRIAAEIVRDAATARNLEDLLIRSSSLILERFRFYYTGIFLIDNNNEFAALVASPTEAGRMMIANDYRVRIGEVGIVGRVSANGEAAILFNKGIDAAYFNNPFLPNTRSELAVPLKVEAKIIGVLDIQSDQPQAFNEDETAILQILADQLASAMERTRLLQTVERNLSELEEAYGRYTLESWKGLTESIQTGSRGYRFDNVRVQPISELPDVGKQAITAGIMINSNGNLQNSGKQNTVAIPVKLRGQTIGVVTVKLKEDYSTNTISTIESATERLALAMESARLYEEARLRADREQSISRITTAISTPTEYDEILRTTVREIGKMLTDTEVSIQVFGDTDELKSDS
jgi:GAF domain-containing protein/HAMP domain-containing protein